MATITYHISLNSGTNTDHKNGATLSAYISRTAGSSQAGAYVTSASLYVSDMRCYTGRNAMIELGSYGKTSSFTQNSATHSETVNISLNSGI